MRDRLRVQRGCCATDPYRSDEARTMAAAAAARSGRQLGVHDFALLVLRPED